ncbi:hypothetical protein Gotri_004137, partial [Gossypium trilobum]|nr:hypothetical protein [Gossypium trilobum]
EIQSPSSDLKSLFRVSIFSSTFVNPIHFIDRARHRRDRKDACLCPQKKFHTRIIDIYHMSITAAIVTMIFQRVEKEIKAGKKKKQEIRRNLIGVHPGRGDHPGGGAPGLDSGKENFTPATQTQGHN